MAFDRHWLWESTHVTGVEAHTALPATPAAIFPATNPVPVARFAQSSPRRNRAIRDWRDIVGMRDAECLCDKPCPRDCRTLWPVLFWLSFAMWSVASEPNLAGLIGHGQSPGSCDFPNISPETGDLCSIRVTGLHHYYVPIRHPPGQTPSLTGSLLPGAPKPLDTRTDFPCCTFDLLLYVLPPLPRCNRSGAYHALFPDDNGLPRYYGESTCTTAFRGLLSVHSRYGP